MKRTLDEAVRIAQRRRLLELEAEVQRATLAATFAAWEQKRALSWVAGAGSLAMRLLAAPRLRWLLAARVLSKISPKIGR